MATVIRDLKPILDPDAVWFVEDAGVPVACCLGFPDINVIIRRIHGRLFPFGFFRLLLGARRLRDYRLWGLAVRPAYQGQGLDVLLYLRLFQSLAHRNRQFWMSSDTIQRETDSLLWSWIKRATSSAGRSIPHPIQWTRRAMAAPLRSAIK